MMKSKWCYIIREEYKDILTNKRSCPACGEYRRIEKLCSFIMSIGVGIYKPYKCKTCDCHINVATGDLLDHVNEYGREYPLDLTINPDIPLWRGLRKAMIFYKGKGH